jgi:hypothetical protein
MCARYVRDLPFLSGDVSCPGPDTFGHNDAGTPRYITSQPLEEK